MARGGHSGHVMDRDLSQMDRDLSQMDRDLSLVDRDLSQFQGFQLLALPFKNGGGSNDPMPHIAQTHMVNCHPSGRWLH